MVPWLVIVTSIHNGLQETGSADMYMRPLFKARDTSTKIPGVDKIMWNVQCTATPVNLEHPKEITTRFGVLTSRYVALPIGTFAKPGARFYRDRMSILGL